MAWSKHIKHSLCILFTTILFDCCHSEQPVINSLEILESLSQLALLRHHPQSIYSSPDNVTESFTSFLQDLRNQNFTDHPALNCSSVPSLSRRLCDNASLSKCMSANEMLELVPQSTKSVSEALARLCPLLLLQMHSNACINAETAPPRSLKPSSASVWGYGVLFVTIISCCSLVGVLILPLLSNQIYQVVLMLFEGLAVGSLVGSSLFHLIPQTFKLVGQNDHHNYLWRSLLIFGGIYLFYLSERFMKVFIDVKKNRKNKKLGYTVGENSTDPLKTFECHVNGTVRLENGGDTLSNGKLQILSAEDLDSYKMDKNDINAKELKNNNEVSHGCHDHNVQFEKGKSAISTVAWMIIFGDGLHNFIDGLSIGAAFSESILAGVSISVAVICEEFPHELGDFAVLLSAGMTVRQALLYNFLSAITCYLGLVLGILLGDLAEGAPYIFALAAGMFLYIALVDMMGELSEALEEARQKGAVQQLKVFFIQNIGILLGVAILFVMARYAEHFNFESISMLGGGNSSEIILEDRMQELYNGLQEAKVLSPLTKL